MVQGMAEQCGGRLTIRSRPGEGTTAEIWFKAAQSPLVERVADDTPLADSSCSLRVLAVDDDAIVLLNTVTMLEDMGHEVTERHSGAEALAALQESDFDLLLSDFAMPGMNGGELIRQARAIQPSIRSAIITGYADLPEGTALDVPRLSKPFSEVELVQLIRNLTADRRAA
jgi:CheY-like chemotaxis protein